MALLSDRCICLRKIEYSETSQIVTLMSREHGLLRLIAKGAHRRTKAGASKFDGGVDFLDVGDAVFTHRPEKDLATLTEWSLREGHLELRKDLRWMYLALYAGELVSLLIEEHDPHPELFDRLEQALSEIASPRAEETFLAFQIDLLRETGYLPELQGCVNCGSLLETTEAAYFSPSRGGIVCRNCEMALSDRQQFDRRLLGLIHTILRLPKSNGVVQRLPRLTRHQTDPINRILSLHMQHTLGRRLRMAHWVVGK